MAIRPLRLASVPVASALLTHVMAGQCSNSWVPGRGMSGVHGSVYAATTWDPDGFGPTAPVLVVGGRISVAGDSAVTNIATWDPTTGVWAPLGLGLGSSSFPPAEVLALAVGLNNELYAGGAFTSSGATALNNIARWNGTAWVGLGSGVTGGSQPSVRALEVLANGDLVVGGTFTTAGGVTANSVARWNGSTWAPLGSGVGANGFVNALRLRPNGRIAMGCKGRESSRGAQNRSLSALVNGACMSRSSGPGSPQQ